MREDGEEVSLFLAAHAHGELQRGLLWGVGRLAETRPEMLLDRNVSDDLLHYLDSADSTVRGLAARNLGLLGSEKAVSFLQEFVEDHSSVILFEHGRINNISVGDLVIQALSRISSPDICE